MATRIEGGCSCGAIRYRVAGTPSSISICHCESCRRASGAPTVSWFVISRQQFTLLSGSPASHRSSAHVHRGFCAKCGTQLTYRHDSAPDIVELTTASLDQPSGLQPTKEIWLSDKLPWVAVNQDLDQHAEEGAPHKTVTVTIYRDGATSFVPIDFDPKAIFGKIRAPVRVALNGYTYRSTIASMGGVNCIPLRKSHREAAGLHGGETLSVTIELDVEPREVEITKDLERMLAASPGRRKKWLSLSYTSRREMAESIDSAKKPATRTRRLAGVRNVLDEPDS
jgi:hypothetical protein